MLHMCILTSMNIFLVFQIKINAANNSNKRHKTKHNQCSHIIFLSLLRFLQQVTERFAPPPREGDGEQTGGQTRSAR